MPNDYSRRRLLQIGGMVSAVLAAGCSSDGSEEQATTTDASGDEENDKPTEETTGEEDQAEQTSNEENKIEVPEVEEPWPMIHRDPARTGYAPELQGPEETPTERWAIDLGGELTSPVVGNDSVFVGSKDGVVHALSVSDGTTEWEFETDGQLESSPVVWNSSVFAADLGGIVYAIDADSGTEQWRFSIPDRGAKIRRPPVVTDGFVYVPQHTDPFRVRAVDASSGVQLWETKSEHFYYDENPGLSIRSGRIYCTGGIFLIGDGEKIRGARGQGIVDLTPVVGPEHAFYALAKDRTVNGGIQGTKPVTGCSDGCWKFTTDALVRSLPAIGPDRIYFGCDDNRIYAVDREQGVNRWNTETGAAVVSSPALAGETLYVGSYDQQVYALNREDGSERWTFDIGSPVASSPAIADGTVFITGLTGSVLALSN